MLQFMGLQIVIHDLVIEKQQRICMGSVGVCSPCNRRPRVPVYCFLWHVAVECATEVNTDIPIYLNSLLIYTNIMSEHWLNDVNVSVPVNGSRDTVSYANLLATSLHVEVLVRPLCLGNSLAWQQEDKRTVCTCCIYFSLLSLWQNRSIPEVYLIKPL